MLVESYMEDENKFIKIHYKKKDLTPIHQIKKTEATSGNKTRAILVAYFKKVITFGLFQYGNKKLPNKGFISDSKDVANLLKS